MVKRTINSPFNTVGMQEWYKGWKEMATPGIYERGIFGDLILPGIACGIKKILLIFNTSLRSPHDPIYVINPSDFNVNPDTEIPILLAYNLVHYESMEPCSNSDIEATIKLVKDYQTGRYQYSRKDLPFLFGIDINNTDREFRMDEQLGYKSDYQPYKSRQQNKPPMEEIVMENPKKRGCKISNKSMNDNEHTKEMGTSEDLYKIKICYRLRGSMIDKFLSEIDGKFQCPICKLLVKNIQLHFHKNLCINKIDADHFEISFDHYKKLHLQRTNKEKKERMKRKNPKEFKEKKKSYKQTYENKNPEKFRLKHLEEVKRHQEKLKKQNPNEFQKKNLANVQKSQEKLKEKKSRKM